jgi:hypothetical protein
MAGAEVVTLDAEIALSSLGRIRRQSPIAPGLCEAKLPEITAPKVAIISAKQVAGVSGTHSLDRVARVGKMLSQAR